MRKKDVSSNLTSWAKSPDVGSSPDGSTINQQAYGDNSKLKPLVSEQTNKNLSF